jgi:hypothetical protein
MPFFNQFKRHREEVFLVFDSHFLFPDIHSSDEFFAVGFEILTGLTERRGYSYDFRNLSELLSDYILIYLQKIRLLKFAI